MKKVIIYFLTILLFISCNNNKPDKMKENLLGDDYRLFQNTEVWELAKAVESEDSLKTKMILDDENVNIDFQEPKFGSTLLMLSIKNSKYKSVKLLLELGANPNLSDFYRGESAVISAANNNNPKYLELLLQYKGNPNAIESAPFRKDDEVRQTALLSAINVLDNNSLKKVKLLVRAGANVNYFNFGHTDLPLAEALSAKKIDVVLYLLQNGADSSLMMYEMIDGHKVYILEALRKCIFDLNSEQYKNKLKVIDLLKEKGLDYNNEPIPDYVLEKIKKQYPESWNDYIKNY
jgi:ankyrin repeat protein